MAARLIAAAAMLAVSATAAGAQIGGQQMSAPRPYGVLLGDVFTLTTRLDAAAPFKLDQSALPKPGPVTYWLDLRSISIRESAGPAGGARYEIAAEYQTFYAALEAIEQTVPPLELVVIDPEGRRAEAAGASFTFVTSPLRPLVATAGGGSAYSLRADAPPIRRSLRDAEIRAAGAGAALVLALAALAWSRAWPPFHNRPARPFAQAARAVSRQARAGENGRRAAALALHRAFDASAGRRLFGEDLETFVSARPAFRRHQAEIAAFFEASRRMFFGDQKAKAALDADALIGLSKQLAGAERAS